MRVVQHIAKIQLENLLREPVQQMTPPRLCRFFVIAFFVKECTRFMSAFEVSVVVPLEYQRVKHSFSFRVVKETRVVARWKVLALYVWVV